MAGMMEDFDAAAPVRSAFCKPLSMDEFEAQGTETTRKALQELMNTLAENPDLYGRIVERKMQEKQEEEEGLLGAVKGKVLSFMGYAAQKTTLSEKAKEEHVRALNSRIASAFEYSRDEKLHLPARRSQRIATKQMEPAAPLEVPPPMHRRPIASFKGAVKHVKASAAAQASASMSPARDIAPLSAPAPPPAPPLPVVEAAHTQTVFTPTKRDGTRVFKEITNGKSLRSSIKEGMSKLKKSASQTSLSGRRTPTKPHLSSSDSHSSLVNHFLLSKFRNARSPSPAHSTSSFGSPQQPLTP